MKHDTFTRLKAFICNVCPFCIAARKWPGSKFARKLRNIERKCPCCRAYARIMADRQA